MKAQAAIDKFREAISECNFRDLGYTGYPYTWSNNRSGEENVQERLDRFLANESWLAIFPWCRIHHLLKKHSDHIPILAECNSKTTANRRRVRKKLWRFEKAWLHQPNCDDILINSWARWGGHQCGSRLNLVCQNIGKTMKMSTRELRSQIEEQKAQLEKLMECSPTRSTIDQIREVTAKIDDLEAQEEEMWHQRSRQNWLTEGDKNTAFFTKKHHREEELMPSTDFKLEMINGKKMKSGLRNSSWTTSMIYTNHEE